MNRDFIRRLWQAARDQGHDLGSPDGEGFDPDSPADDGNPFGMSEAELTLVVDVSAYVDHKRVAMRCHASQVSDSSFFMQMAPEAFAAAFGSEWFIEHNVDKYLEPGWLLA